MDKLTAARVFRALDLEALPTTVYPAATGRPTALSLANTFGRSAKVTIRTAVEKEMRNLPRVVGIGIDEAAIWISRLPPNVSVLVQPYSQIVFSVELAVYPEWYVAELQAGIWELSTQAKPATLFVDEHGNSIRLEWPPEDGPALFHTLDHGYETRVTRIQDWQIACVSQWIANFLGSLRRLLIACRGPFGLKMHYAFDFGLSPQNVRTGLPDIGSFRAACPADVVVIDNLEANVPYRKPVLLSVSIVRENHAALNTLIDKLRAADVETVYVCSGILSHLAISLREAGLRVRRSEGVLRDRGSRRLGEESSGQ